MEIPRMSVVYSSNNAVEARANKGWQNQIEWIYRKYDKSPDTTIM